MIKFKISGAGGGKTTGLVEEIYCRYLKLKEYKKIFVITYTNYAVNQIINCYISRYGYLPSNIKIMTVHKFCIKEIINPYYKYVFCKNPIEGIVTFNYNHNRKFYEFSRYLEKNIIHSDNVFSMAKWILCGKSGFNKNQRQLTSNAFKYFISDIDSIFIDEYQDLDNDILDIVLKIVDNTKIYMSIVGDPKQHIMGTNYSHNFILEFKSRGIIPDYTKECFRCGKNLVNLSNKLCDDKEKQISNKPNMRLKYIFYEDLEPIVSILKSQGKEILIYMRNSNEFFKTNKKVINDFSVKVRDFSSFDTKYINKRINLIANNKYNLHSKIKEINKLLSEFKIELSKELYEQLLDYLEKNTITVDKSIEIYSINKVKGLEADYCFYIIDNIFLKYLNGNYEPNNERNKVYVALTRAKKELYIVIPKSFKKISDLEKLGIEKIDKIGE